MRIDVTLLESTIALELSFGLGIMVSVTYPVLPRMDENAFDFVTWPLYKFSGFNGILYVMEASSVSSIVRNYFFFSSVGT